MLTDRNTNRPGYKKTKVGWIPEDWTAVLLSDMCAVRFSGVDKKCLGEERTVRLCNYTDVYYNDKIVSGMSFMTATASQREREQFELKAGDVLLTKDSETADDIAKCAYVPQDLPGVLCGYHLALLRPNQVLVSGKFLSHKLNAHETRQRFSCFANGVTRFGLNLETFREFFVALPPLPEQKKIAEILSTWDEAIEQTRQFIATAKRRKKALMQKLLTGKKRLPGFKEKWKVFHLGDLCLSLASGGTPSTANTAYWQGAIPWVTGADIGEGNISYGRRFISSKALQDSNTVLCERGDVALVTRTGVGKWALIVRPTAISQDITRIRFQPHIMDALFGGFAISSSIPNLLKYNQGTSIAGIQKEDLRHYALRIPAISEQRAIAAVLASADDEIAALESKLAALEKQKRGLMQKLLSGEVRVNATGGIS